MYIEYLAELINNDHFVFADEFGQLTKITTSRDGFIIEHKVYDSVTEEEQVEKKSTSILHVLFLLASSMETFEQRVQTNLSKDNYAYIKYKCNQKEKIKFYPSYRYISSAIISLRIADFIKKKSNNKILSFNFAKFNDVREPLSGLKEEEIDRLRVYSYAELELRHYTEELLLANKEQTKVSADQRYQYIYSYLDETDTSLEEVNLLDVNTKIDMEEFGQTIIYHYKFQESNKELFAKKGTPTQQLAFYKKL